MDVHSPEQRSFNMSRIRGKNTDPEIEVDPVSWLFRTFGENSIRGLIFKRKMVLHPCAG